MWEAVLSAIASAIARLLGSSIEREERRAEQALANWLSDKDELLHRIRDFKKELAESSKNVDRVKSIAHLLPYWDHMEVHEKPLSLPLLPLLPVPGKPDPDAEATSRALETYVEARRTEWAVATIPTLQQAPLFLRMSAHYYGRWWELREWAPAHAEYIQQLDEFWHILFKAASLYEANVQIGIMEAGQKPEISQKYFDDMAGVMQEWADDIDELPGVTVPQEYRAGTGERWLGAQA